MDTERTARAPAQGPRAPRARLLQAAPYLALAVVLALVTTPAVALVSCGGALALVVALRRGEGRWLRPLPAFALFAVAIAAHAWLVTHGTFTFAGRERFSGTYDSLARSLRHGSAEVDVREIYTEAWLLNGRAYTYFGPLPALLRVVPDLIAPSLYGLWARISVFLANLLSIAAVAALARRELAANPALDDRRRSSLLLATVAAFALGTPLAVLGSVAVIYHEAIVWGLAPALWGLYFTLGELRSGRGLAALSALAGCAFLARLTFGGPLFLLAGILGVRRLIRARQEGKPLWSVAKRIALAALPAIVAVLVQLAYNRARFGGWLKFVDFDAYVGVRPRDGQTFSFSRIPIAASLYFGISPANFSAHVPFLLFWETIPPPEVYNNQAAPLLSPLLGSPWLLFGWMGGVAFWRRSPERGWLTLCAVPFVLECVLILGYYWLGYRFLAEFLPLWLLLHAVYLRHVGAPSAISSLIHPRRFAWVAALSVLATLASLFHYETLWWPYPFEHQVKVSKTLEALDAKLGLAHRRGE